MKIFCQFSLTVLFILSIFSISAIAQDLSKYRIEKIDPLRNNDIDLTYTVPIIFSEIQSPIRSIFKSYISPAINNKYILRLEIGITHNNTKLQGQYLDSLILTTTNLIKEIGKEQEIEIKKQWKTKISFCDAIVIRINKKIKENNISFFYEDNITYSVFINNSVVRFAYRCIYENEKSISENADKFEDFVNTQVSNIVIYNSLYNLLPEHLKSDTTIPKKKDFVNIAIEDIKANKYEAAISYLDSAIKEDPYNAYAYYFRGNSRLETNQVTLAIEDYTKAIQLMEKFEFYIQRSIAKIRLKDYQGSLSDINREIELNPQPGSSYTRRGILNVLLKKDSLALYDFNKAIEINPNDVLSLVYRGDLKTRNDDKKGGLSDYDKAIEIEPLDEEVYLKRGAVNAKLGNISKSIFDFNKAIQLNPNNSESYYIRGMTYILSLENKNQGCLDLKMASKLGSSKSISMLNKYCK